MTDDGEWEKRQNLQLDWQTIFPVALASMHKDLQHALKGWLQGLTSFEIAWKADHGTDVYWADRVELAREVFLERAEFFGALVASPQWKKYGRPWKVAEECKRLAGRG